MPERVEAFPRLHRSNVLFDGCTDGAIWHFTEAEWSPHYKSDQSVKASASHFGKSRGFKTKVMMQGSDLYVCFSAPAEGKVAAKNELAQQRAVKRQGRLAGQG